MYMHIVCFDRLLKTIKNLFILTFYFFKGKTKLIFIIIDQIIWRSKNMFWILHRSEKTGRKGNISSQIAYKFSRLLSKFPQL
jgi:hypothetical protein